MSNSSRSGRLSGEVRVGLQSLGERREQPRGVVDVLELDHLDRRVHVAQRDRDDARRDPGGGDVDGVGVGPRRPRARGHRERDALLLGRLVEQFEDDGVERRAAADHRARAEAMAAELLLVEAGSVGREGHVDRDRDVGPQRERRRARAREGDLLLGDGRAVHVAGRAAGLGDEPRGLERHEAAEPVVERARDEPPVGQLDGLAGDHRHVADAHARARVVAVLGADVDVQALELGRLAPVLLGLEQVDRLLADHAGHRPVARGDLDPLADEDHGVPAADAGEPEEAVVVDVVDDQPDLVDVADDRQGAAVAGAGHLGDGRADGVAGDLGEGAGGLAEDGGGRLLVPRGAGGGEQLQEGLGDGHWRPVRLATRRQSPDMSCRSTNCRIPPCL